MADNLRAFETNKIPTKDIGQTVDEMVIMSAGRRLNFERKWYDNNFFDDGHHYRFLSRSSNKIIDVSERSTVFAPMRAIPKTSRQIRGVANLLVAPDFIPVIYPEKKDMEDVEGMEMAKQYAHKVSRWMQKEWQDQDLQEKLAFMAILAAKHSVSWIQVWPDAVEEAIKTQVYDAFDIYVMGQLTDPEDSPFIIKATPQIISQIKANEYFDKNQKMLISPDNKMANSEIKQAYMSTRYNRQNTNDQAATLLLKEAYIKEYLDSDNHAKIKLQKDGDKILKGKKEGDMVMRQVFVAGNVWLRDRYVNLPAYPFVDFRYEPGPIYNVSLIERFIPTNKSLDALVSRAERYSHTMVTGSWSQRASEQYEIENSAGGQIFKYQTTPPVQNQIAPIPNFFFELMNMMQRLIEEQGVTTSTLGKLPSGVKANAAIESLKESEYANLIISSRRLKNTVKKVSQKMMDIADNHFVTPKTVYDMKDGNPMYFDVIGGSALATRQQDPQLMEGISQNIVPIKKDYRVEIEVQSGMGFTHEGKKAAAKELGDYMIQLAQLQMVSPEVVKVYLRTMLEIYNFGPTEDIMSAIEKNKVDNMSEEQLMKMKVAILEALKDAGEVGPEASQRRVDENKLGTLEALKDSGLADKINEGGVQDNPEIAPIPYKDAPEDIKRQMEVNAGLQPSQGLSPSASKQISTHEKMIMDQKKLELEKQKGARDATNARE